MKRSDDLSKGVSMNNLRASKLKRIEHKHKLGRNRAVFRDYVAQDYLYVLEASPYGDIFFVERDLSKLIHEPGESGIQKIVIPTNVRSIEAAIWL